MFIVYYYAYKSYCLILHRISVSANYRTKYDIIPCDVAYLIAELKLYFLFYNSLFELNKLACVYKPLRLENRIQVEQANLCLKLPNKR